MNSRLIAVAVVAAAAVVGAPAAARAPAGRPIVFLSDWPTNLRAHQIYLAGAAGGLRAVGDQAVLPGDSPSWGPSWSPDSRSIAFGHNTAAGWELAVVAADGSGMRAITPPVRPAGC